ncbi:DEAD/DEAH box helicase family protein [Tropicimonas marinistellae]|uniref:DEAD/DEAH box helicase family protein n=1 Tax=Tropicimonas marinistellae TaxID=1739787 RepID=UPI00082E8727|nr:DEAD/DEAH box helicase family protein [Tropicimonas marinistellae]
MSLMDVSVPFYVTTTEHDPIADFFDPVLERASTYDIAVGYFSTAWLRDAAHGITEFARAGGKARWIISPELSEEDFRALVVDAERAEKQVRDAISRSYEELFSKLTQRTREAMGWLILDGVLTFKIGIPRNRLSGIMHAKQGQFRDKEGNRIGFLGSYNLTGGARTNWEAFSVFCDWSSEESMSRNDAIGSSFERMWLGHDPNLAVYDPKEADLSAFVAQARGSARHYDLFQDPRIESPRIPSHFLNDGGLRDYQEEGIKNWFKNNGKGILHMATGTGKTVTALTAVTRLNEYITSKQGELLTVIAVPYQHLAEQWAKEASEFGYDPILCYGGLNRWMNKAQSLLNDLRAKVRHHGMFIVVNASLRDNPFQVLIEQAPGHLLFVGDEMHNLGARNALEALPQNAQFRLGLSATPERSGDEEGTSELQRYFGQTVLEFGLDKAINGGFLCRYFYYPVLVHFDEEEQIEYDELSIQISKLFAQGEKPDDQDGSEALKRLLIRRARLIGKARGKLPALLQLLKNQEKVHHTLVYCGDSKEEEKRYIDTALERIGSGLGLRANKFTSEENAAERKRLLSQFASGELQVLLAIRCLDEGVDVPMTQTAFILASSTNPKEFIQRRGRVLRRFRGKDRAKIYDFIVTPSPELLDDKGVSSVERSLMRRELARFNEFAGLAENHGEALSKIREIKERLRLLDH